MSLLPCADGYFRRRVSSSIGTAHVSVRRAIVTVRVADVVCRSHLASVGSAGVRAGHLETPVRRAAFVDRRAGSCESSVHAIARRDA